MTDENYDLDSILHEILTLYRQDASPTNHYTDKIHVLAKHRHEPAKIFFIKCLESHDTFWRYDCLSALGFHYDLKSDFVTLDKIRNLLLTDSDELIRSAAAKVLGLNSTFSDLALHRAINEDTQKSVKISAFAALLRLCHFPTKKYLQTVKYLKVGKIPTTVTALKRLLEQEGLKPHWPHDK